MLYTGVLTAKNILIVFLLIGMMTALWRACGTIPYIICHAAKLLRPEAKQHAKTKQSAADPANFTRRLYCSKLRFIFLSFITFVIP